MSLPQETMKKLLPLKDVVVGAFTAENWYELGILTGLLEWIRAHPRLIRSLSWQDSDYSEHALDALIRIVGTDEANFGVIERYVADKFGTAGEFVSSAGAAVRKITFSPHVFHVPESEVNPELVSVMMPFGAEFGEVHLSITKAVRAAGLLCQRADDIWEDSSVVQDVFGLIFRSAIVICDLSGRNSNVFYETGIAHTLGKHVIPIAQSVEDVPFDLRHQRFIRYLDNAQGRCELESALEARIRFLHGRSASVLS